MTENEAISKIQWRINTASEIAGRGEDGKAFEDLEMAIQALEEIQQYRAIGTVEQLQFMKSVCEMSDDMLKSLADSVRARLKYEAIGSVEEFKALKEKNEPKKPNEISWGATSCPICSYEFGFGSHFKHCSKCGQKIDWQ